MFRLPIGCVALSIAMALLGIEGVYWHVTAGALWGALCAIDDIWSESNV